MLTFDIVNDVFSESSSDAASAYCGDCQTKNTSSAPEKNVPPHLSFEAMQGAKGAFGWTCRLVAQGGSFVMPSTVSDKWIYIQILISH